MKQLNEIKISFEVFPPKTTEGLYHLSDVCDRLNQFNPRYYSVTFGAAGAMQDRTLEVVRHLIKNKIKTVPHISCVAMTSVRLHLLLKEYIQLGIDHLVVIQGDSPKESEDFNRDFHYANELIEAIRQLTGDHFHLSVASYPEFHPHSKNFEIDLSHFKRKVETGANSSITQFFYNSDAYFRFLEACERLAINTPIIPGIMPITDYARLIRFSSACGAEIPLWLRKQLEVYADDPASLKKLGVEVVSKLCERLLKENINEIHFYILNQLEPTQLILNNLGLISGIPFADECIPA